MGCGLSRPRGVPPQGIGWNRARRTVLIVVAGVGIVFNELLLDLTAWVWSNLQASRNLRRWRNNVRLDGGDNLWTG